MNKFLTAIIASALFLTSFAGCGSSGNNDANTTKDVASASDSTTGGASETKTEPVILSFVGKLSQDDVPIYDAFFKRVHDAMLEQGYDITVKIEQVQSGTYSEKLGLLLQSGNIPDIIYFQGGDYQFAITQKILEDLSSYVNNSPTVQASMNEFNKQRFANYPYLLWLNPTITPVPVVRQDFFDKTESGKALMADPSIDNYYAFFKELKEKNNVKAAFTAAGSLSELDTIFDEAFGNTSTWIKNSDGTYSYARVTEGEKKKLEFYAKLFKEGLLDNEYLTKQWDTKERAFYDGEAAIISGTQGKVIDLYNTHMIDQNGPDAKLVVLPPAKDVGQGYNPIDVSKESRGFAISALSNHKKEAFALMEFLATPEGQMMDKLGEKGVQYDIVDNKIKLLPPFKDWYERFWGTTVNFKLEYPFDESTPFLSVAATDSLDKVEQYGTSDNVFIIPPELAAKMDAAKAIYTEFATDVVTGKKTVDEFDAFVKNFMDNGGKDITEYANKTLK